MDSLKSTNTLPQFYNMDDVILSTLQAVRIDGNLLSLPNLNLPRQTYLKVAAILEMLGGKWNSGKRAFIFKSDPTPLLQSILGQEPINFKKEYQYFPTPSHVGEKMVEMLDLEEEHLLLEPSAGQGHLVLEVLKRFPSMQVDCYEIFEPNRIFLRQIPNVNLFTEPDFLEGTNNLGKYDRIIANPPFSKNRDILHIYRMFVNLKPGGKMVTLSGPHWKISGNKTETMFREWLEEVKAEFYEIEANSFEDTKVQTTIIKITK